MGSQPSGWLPPPYNPWQIVTFDGVCTADKQNPATNYNNVGQVAKAYLGGVDLNWDKIAFVHLTTPLSKWLFFRLRIGPSGSVQWVAPSISAEKLTWSISPVVVPFNVATLTWNTMPALVGAKDTNWVEIGNAGPVGFTAGEPFSMGELNDGCFYANGDEATTYSPKIVGFAITADWSNTGVRANFEAGAGGLSWVLGSQSYFTMGQP